MIKGDFTRRKFLTFPLERQHRKCAELLRISYEKKVLGQSIGNEILAYRTLAEWMEHPIPNLDSLEIISDAYHCHARLAGLKHKEHHLLPTVRQGDKSSSKHSWNISIYLDNIRSAHNVGSILRTVEAFSLGNVYFSEATPFITNKQVKDTAMGAEKWVNCTANASLATLIRPVIVLETSDSAIPIYEFLFPKFFTLVMGNEEYGCSEKTLQIADAIIEIPLRGHKNSLNVANALAIAAGEISRQKTLYSQIIGEELL